ncbi:MAG TPA: Gfo/Idh/MocA family oxidoreductase [Allosphingosinicella sp.]|jgi:virulence factor
MAAPIPAETDLRVALIGLGDIARKAYLPVLAARPGLRLRLVTRNAAPLDELGRKYRIEERHSDIGEAIEAGLDAAFVHAATAAHPEIVEQLLEAGVAVYVDKPLATDLDTCRRLVDMAEAAGRTLMVGFNRRYAPAYRQLLERPRNLILMAKNRRRLPGSPRQVVFDDFIHVVDTLLALVPAAVESRSIDARLVGGKLHHVTLRLAGEGFMAIGIMNRMSGSDEESLEVMGDGAKIRVENLADVIDYDGDERLTRRPDWKPATWVRGIDQICDRFLAAVRAGERLSGAEALTTHALCEAVVREVEGEASSVSGDG